MIIIALLILQFFVTQTTLLHNKHGTGEPEILTNGVNAVATTESQLNRQYQLTTVPAATSADPHARPQDDWPDPSQGGIGNPETSPVASYGSLTSSKCILFTYGHPEKNMFYSPNYPGNYTNHTECVKVLEAPPGHTIKLDFRDKFDVERSQNCRFDYLEIRDGPNGYNKLIGVYCGRSFPPVITSSGRYLWLRFISDDNIETSGFKAVYEWVPRPEGTEIPEATCKKYVTGIEGFVNKTDIEKEFTDRSMEFGVPLECMWIIQVQEGWRVQLQFIKFNLEVPNDCEANFVDVFPERADLRARLGNFCGSIADMVQSPAAVMKIRFLAMPTGGIKSNFEALWTAFRNKTKSVDPGGCEEDEYDCEDATCISALLKCNGRINCRFRSDEEKSRCELKVSFIEMILSKEHMIIIIIVFFLILTGMCFAFLFNCFRKLVRDHRIIQEHMRRSREARLHEESKMSSTYASKRDLYVQSTVESISSSGGGVMGGGDLGEDMEVEMRDSVAQTLESVFIPNSNSTMSTNPHRGPDGAPTDGGDLEDDTDLEEAEHGLLAPLASRIDFSTFGRGGGGVSGSSNRRFGGSREPRALSFDSTKSAPDVIMTWSNQGKVP